MKSKILLVIIFIIFLSLSVFSKDLDFQNDLNGYIRYMMGYITGQGVEENYAILIDSLGYLYDINLHGQLLYNGGDITYSLQKYMYEDLDVRFKWNNSYFSAQYDKEIKLNFPEINLAFKNNEINGLKIHTLNDNSALTLFHGMETFYPMTVIIPGLMPGENKIRLFDYHEPSIPPSAGDIMQNSEVITANGIVLTSQEDYILNYLNSDLTLLVSLEPGTVIEAKFQFKPAKEELAIPGEKIKGIVFTKHWLENNLSGFYVKRGEEFNTVGGVAGRYISDPVSFEGEWAVSTGENNPPSQAYYMKLSLLDEKMNFSCNLSGVDPHFKEMGINSFNRGFSSEVKLFYEADDRISLEMVHKKYDNVDDDEILHNNFFGETITYDLNKESSIQLIFEDKKLDTNTKSTVSKDLAFGYRYENDYMALSLGQYFKETDKHFIKYNLDFKNFDLATEYKVNEGVSGKEHQIDVVSFMSPFFRTDINSIIEYRKPFSEKKGDMRIIVNGTGFFNHGFSATAQYVYFTEVKNQGKCNRYNFNLQYDKNLSSSSINFLLINNRSATAQSFIQEINAQTVIPVGQNFQIHYNGLIDSYGQKTVLDNSINSGSHNLSQEVGLTYFRNDFLSFKTKVNQQSYLSWHNQFNEMKYELVYDKNTTYQYGIEMEYENFADKNVKFSIDYQPGYFDPNWDFMGQIRLTLEGFTLKSSGNFQYSVQKKNLVNSKYSCSLLLSRVKFIQPSFTFNYEKNNEEGSRYIIKNYEFDLRYLLTDSKSIFARVKKDYLNSQEEEERNIDSFGILTGIEYNF